MRNDVYALIAFLIGYFSLAEKSANAVFLILGTAIFGYLWLLSARRMFSKTNDNRRITPIPKRYYSGYAGGIINHPEFRDLKLSLYEGIPTFIAGSVSDSPGKGVILFGNEFLNRFNGKQKMAIVAHELGHIRRNHSFLKNIVMSLVLSFLALLWYVWHPFNISWFIGWMGCSVLVFLTGVWLDHWCEFDADREAVKLCGEKEGMLEVLRYTLLLDTTMQEIRTNARGYSRLGLLWKVIPGASSFFSKVSPWFASHPPPAERIRRIQAFEYNQRSGCPN